MAPLVVMAYNKLHLELLFYVLAAPVRSCSLNIWQTFFDTAGPRVGEQMTLNLCIPHLVGHVPTMFYQSLFQVTSARSILQRGGTAWDHLQLMS